MSSDGEEFVEDEYLKEKNMKLRNYQIKLIELAKQQNSIIFLPAGAGKTLISIHVLCSRIQEIKPAFSAGGKRVFFVENTKVMVNQIYTTLRMHTKFKIGFYTGDMSVDLWNKKKWLVEFEKYHVLVLTAEILRQILQFGYISPANISLVIFDECHNAVHDHPYCGILRILSDADPSEAPLILGLSAVLLKANTNENQVKRDTQSLEAAFKGKVITESDTGELLSFSANPKEEIVYYKVNSYSSYIEAVVDLYEKTETVLSKIFLKSALIPEIPKDACSYKNQNSVRRIKNAFVNAKTHLQELGAYCGSLSALFYIILLEKYRLLSEENSEIQVLVYARTELNKARRMLIKAMGEEESSDLILEHSTHKIHQLINVISNCPKPPQILIFVKQRVMAIILAFLLKRLGALGGPFSYIKADFVVGTTVYAKESIFIGSKSEEIVQKFASRNLNVLVATNVLEEGIDFVACSTVISFDFPDSYSSFFQSRGRARNKESAYFIFAPEEKKSHENTLHRYKLLNKKLNEIVAYEYEETEYEDASIERPDVLTLGKELETIQIDGITAMTVVQRYCSKLPQDKFSNLCPLVWHVKKDDKRQAFLQLPNVSPLRRIIEGDVKQNSKQAKKSVFLKTVKLLYELGEINESLESSSFKTSEMNFEDIFPHFINEKIDKSLPQPGTNKRKQNYKIKYAECLSESLPSPGINTYLHVINFTVVFDKPTLEYKTALYNLLQTSCSYAILSTKRLSKICQFPLFLDMGQINCDFLVNYEELTFTEPEIYDIKLFHLAVFKKVMRISKNAQVFDNRNKENSFFIVPVDKNEEGRFVINWDLIRCDFCKGTVSAVVGYNPSSIRGSKKKINDSENNCKAAGIEMRPGEEHNASNSLVPSVSFDGRMLWTARQSVDESREPNFTMTEAYYKYFVISPNYRNFDPPQYYVVSKVCHDMSPFSPFPKLTYENYYTYYRNKYEIEITNPNQPLLRVSSIFQCSNYNKPGFKIGSRGKKSRDRFKEYEEHLIPELCDVSPFINKYWVKANLLPTFLNRIAHIYCVEEFRRNLVTESGLGVCEIPEDVSWHPLKVDEKLIYDEEEDAPSAGFVPHLEMKSLPLSELKNKSYQKSSKNIKDPERHLYEVGLCDLEYFMNAVKEMDAGKEFDNYCLLEKNDEITKLKSLRNIEIPKLMIFTGGTSKWGAELAELVKVGTAKSANDIVDYERLEILGDSFLKFAASLFLFRNYSYHEGILTSLKGKIIGNRNLFYCGSAKNIQNIINVIDFVPLSDWNPPLLHIPERLVREIVSNEVDPAVIYRFDISHEEQCSGILSENTFLENEKIIRNYEKWCEQPNFSPYRIIKDKTVSDCVEALIGAYLQALGLPAAFEILMWMGILPKPKGSFDELVGRPNEADLNFRTETTVMTLLDEVFYSDLEDILDYHFQNKALLLEALTHPSYPYNRVTNCYQRLEFLGDAILDFLLTSYIYEYGGHLTPGQVTDLRSALVNNITFACITVRYELHKYLLSFNSALTKAIETFVNHQISRNHLVDENVLILLEEKDSLVAESIQVPKVLGDIFESLAGAIFIDSGNSLETVWNVYYKLMKREIDEFTKIVPKNSIRLLTEICNDKPYYEFRKCDECMKVACTIYYNNHEINTHGFGPNKKEAKRSAAKFAIKKVLEINNG